MEGEGKWWKEGGGKGDGRAREGGRDLRGGGGTAGQREREQEIERAGEGAGDRESG